MQKSITGQQSPSGWRISWPGDLCRGTVILLFSFGFQVIPGIFCWKIDFIKLFFWRSRIKFYFADREKQQEMSNQYEGKPSLRWKSVTIAIDSKHGVSTVLSFITFSGCPCCWLWDEGEHLWVSWEQKDSLSSHHYGTAKTYCTS